MPNLFTFKQKKSWKSWVWRFFPVLSQISQFFYGEKLRKSSDFFHILHLVEWNILWNKIFLTKVQQILHRNCRENTMKALGQNPSWIQKGPQHIIYRISLILSFQLFKQTYILIPRLEFVIIYMKVSVDLASAFDL